MLLLYLICMVFSWCVFHLFHDERENCCKRSFTSELTMAQWQSMFGQFSIQTTDFRTTHFYYHRTQVFVLITK